MTDKTRIPLGNSGWYFEKRVIWYDLCDPSGRTFQSMSEFDAQAFSAALTPQVAKTDEEVARVIDKDCHTYSSDDYHDYTHFDREKAAALIARHRNAATAEVESRLEAEQRAMEVVAAENMELRALMEKADELIAEIPDHIDNGDITFPTEHLPGRFHIRLDTKSMWIKALREWRTKYAALQQGGR